MAKKEQIKKKQQIVYAKNCIHSDKTNEVYPLILYCKIIQIGCHSKSNCKYYSEIKRNKSGKK